MRLSLRKGIATVGLLAATATMATVGTATSASADPNVRNISEGSSNHHGVWCIQAAINDWRGKNVLAEDGDFGPNTLKQVVAFQKAMGIPHDGIVGPQTGSYIWIYDNYSDYCYRYVPTL